MLIDEKKTKLGDLPFATSLSDVGSFYSPTRLKPEFSERNRTFHEQTRMDELQRVIRTIDKRSWIVTDVRHPEANFYKKRLTTPASSGTKRK